MFKCTHPKIQPFHLSINFCCVTLNITLKINKVLTHFLNQLSNTHTTRFKNTLSIVFSDSFFSKLTQYT